MTKFVAGFFAPWIIYALIMGLHLLLPARKVAGYVRDEETGALLEYRLNGPLVLTALVILWVVTARTHVFAGMALRPPLVGSGGFRGPRTACDPDPGPARSANRPFPLGRPLFREAAQPAVPGGQQGAEKRCFAARVRWARARQGRKERQ